MVRIGYGATAMATRPSVMIAGCGDVGIRLGLQLSRAGWTVYGLRRQAASLPVPILPVRGDLASAAAVVARGVAVRVCCHAPLTRYAVLDARY